MRSLFGLLILSLMFNLNAKTLSEDEIKNKAYIYYRNGVNEYNKENYAEALKNLEKSNQYRSTKKTRKLIENIRKKGKSFYETGTALVNFDKEMSVKYLEKALPLIDPKDKKTVEHINSLLQDQ